MKQIYAYFGWSDIRNSKLYLEELRVHIRSGILLQL